MTLLIFSILWNLKPKLSAEHVGFGLGDVYQHVDDCYYQESGMVSVIRNG